MTKEQIHQKLQSIFRDVFDEEDLCVFDDTTAADIEDWDSLAQIDLILAIEQEFKIKFNILEVTEMKNVGDMLAAIMNKVSQ